MAADETLGAFKDINLAGKLSGISDLTQYLPLVIGALVFSIGLSFLIKYITHRISVEKIYKIQGGYITKTKRYKESYDKGTKLANLRAMFGGEKLPLFPTKYFQKVKSFPLFGAKRQISLIFPNKRSPKILMKDVVVDYDSKRWTFMNERQSFIKKINKAELIMTLAYIAPIVIIVATFIFFSVLVFLQIGITNRVGDEISNLAKVLMEMYGK